MVYYKRVDRERYDDMMMTVIIGMMMVIIGMMIKINLLRGTMVIKNAKLKEPQ